MRRIPLFAPFTFLALAACTPACASRPTDADPAEPEETLTTSSALAASIAEVTAFGSNPGALKMFEHAPPSLPAGAPIVVVLHGCTEGAAAAATTGWSELADQAKFLVVYPEQQTANNPIKCFNWGGEYGDPSNLQRGKGENLSIKQMVDKAIATHGSDPKRVFVVGFSAGGGTAAIMAATYPDVFAAGATIAGLPYACATTLAESTSCMSPGKTRTAADWAALVKAAAPGVSAPWPRMSIWQGSADTTVATMNRTELVKQWTGVHGIAGTAPVTDTVDGQSHAIYKDASGKVLVESYDIAGMAHGVPVAPKGGCGSVAAYAFDKGICAAGRIASFFGIASATGPQGSDAGSDSGSKPSGTGSGALSSSSSTGGPAANPGGAGAPTGPSDFPERSAGSTCSASSVPGGPTSPAALSALGLLLAFAATRARSTRRADKGVLR